MALTTGLHEVQALLEYNFKDLGVLLLALTAADADGTLDDDNRKLAQLGEKLIELLVAENAFSAGQSRGEVPHHFRNARILTPISWCER